MMELPLLDVRDLSVSYGINEVLHKISFTLSPGEILAIVGESGSGKSTVLKAVQGLLGKGGRVVGGSIRFAGKDITCLPDVERRKLAGEGMAMIFQNAGASFCPIRTVGDQIYEVVQAHRDWDRKTFKIRAGEIMRSIHLEERVLDEYPFRLSGGMGQRAGILAATILSPKLLLADEPTSALDAVTQVSVVRELMDLRQRKGISIVIVTHHMGVAWYMADRILILHKGGMVECGTRDEIFLSPREDYTKELIRAVLRIERIRTA